MSARLFALSVALLASVGCAGSPQTKQEMEALKAYTSQLEKENADLRKYRQAYESLKQEMDFTGTEAKMLEDLRTALLEALKGIKIDSGDVQYDPKTGKYTMAADLLFDSGSFRITAKGEEVLKKFAETFKAKPVTLRIVGHTDRDPIAKANTKQALHFDHNMELGALRACSVFMTLSKHGVAQGRMFVESWGNNHPVVANDNRSDHKRKNRRVEIFLLTEGGAPPRR